MAPPWTVVDGLTEPERRDVDSLLRSIADTADDEALTEAPRERLESGAPVRHGLRRAPDGLLTGYALLHDDDALDAEPALGTYDQGLADLLATHGGPVALLLRERDADASAALVHQGWRERRALRLLRRSLPAAPVPPADVASAPSSPVATRPRGSRRTTRRSPATPPRSHMTVELRAREPAAWFDPKGFLLFFDGDELVASCWTKVHHRHAGDVGEIYVVSVDPRRPGPRPRTARGARGARPPPRARGRRGRAVRGGVERRCARPLRRPRLQLRRARRGAVLRASGQPAPTARPTP